MIDRKESVIYISGNDIEVTGFTIANSSEEWLEAGIKSYHSRYINIHGNIIHNNCIGVLLDSSNYNIIENNILIDSSEEGVRLIDSRRNNIERNVVESNREVGITISRSSNNKISNNSISRNKVGIWVWYQSENNEVTANVLYFNLFGMDLSVCGKNKIKGNTFRGNIFGITLWWSQGNIIKSNNFFFNGMNAFFCTSFLNIWIRNFWGRPHFMPKPILGVVSFFPSYLFLIWFNFDFIPRLFPLI